MASDEKTKQSTTPPHRRPISSPSISPSTAKHAIAFVSLLLLLSRAGAQPTGSTPYPPVAKFSPSMAIIIVILIAALFLMGFFSIYIRHCSEANPGGASVRPLGGIGASLRRRVASRGLDAAVIDTFPTFAYSAVKGLKIGKGALECAVCLNEFEDDETLRLIPKCDHVFHPECIDAWLSSHVTCPVCRANLVPQPGETIQVPEYHPESDDPTGTQDNGNDDVAIRVAEDEGGDGGEAAVPIPVSIPPPQVVDRNKSANQNRPPRSRSVRQKLFGTFPRSHSTGHSLVQPGENTDRFTLRLPDDVRKRMMSRALNRTTSCLVAPLPREGSTRRGFRSSLFGEGSSRGARSFSRLDRVQKSDRWVFSMAPPFFSRSSSLRSPKVMSEKGNGSSRGARTAVKLPSFKHSEPKSEETGLVSDDSARLPV